MQAWAVAQRFVALLALVLTLPLLLALGLAIRLDTPGPMLHRARRVRPGGTFVLYKLRSMRIGQAGNLGVTAGGDARVTRVGRLIRRTKIDELPQLWNVVRGDMLLVGPRPEDPTYVNRMDPVHEAVFNATPGITGAASVAYRDEEAVLARTATDLARRDGRFAVTAADVDRAYRDIVLPAKLQLEADYLGSRTIRSDLALIGATLGLIVRESSEPRSQASHHEDPTDPPPMADG